MALTNFAALTDEQLTVWSRDFWRAARNRSYLNKFVGTSADSMVQRITELTKDKKGARAVLTLVQDLEGDGVAGDRTLEGNEEALSSDDVVIRIDQLRNATRHQGRMADQKSVVGFREQARDKLAYWLADRIDQMMFLTLAGVQYTEKNRGGARTGSDLANLEFAADVTGPSTNRLGHIASSGDTFTTGSGSAAACGNLTYDNLMDIKAHMKENYIKPIRGEDGMEVYNVFATPTVVAALKQDDKFHQAWRDALPRSANNPLFKGSNAIYVDGLAIHEHRHSYSAPDLVNSGNPGARVVFAGAQAMGMADVGMAEWVEDGFDYENQQGISVGKIFGLLKPKFYSIYQGSEEDFGVYCVDVTTLANAS